MTPEEQITLYASLSPAEQAEVEAYVAANPALRPLLDDAKRLHALADRLRERDAVTAEDLAEALVGEHMGLRSETARARQARVQAALEADPSLRATYERMQDRLRAFDEAGTSPLAQFERLTGHALDPVRDDADSDQVARGPGTRGPAAQDDAPAVMRRVVPPSDSSPPGSPSPGLPQAPARAPRQQARPLRRVAIPRWAIAAAVLVAVVGIGLFAADPLLTPPHQERADLDGLTAALPILRAPVRGPAPDATSAPALQRAEVQAAYADALEAIEAAARPGPLGLFDTYDSEGLDRAAMLLRDVTTQEAVAPDLALDAAYAVGSIRLYQDRRTEACAAFERVVREQGPRSADADTLVAEFCED